MNGEINIKPELSEGTLESERMANPEQQEKKEQAKKELIELVAMNMVENIFNGKSKGLLEGLFNELKQKVYDSFDSSQAYKTLVSQQALVAINNKVQSRSVNKNISWPTEEQLRMYESKINMELAQLYSPGR